MDVILRALFIGTAFALLLAVIWRYAVSSGLPISAYPAMLSIVAVLLIVGFVHEVLHVIAFPNFGFGDCILGIEPRAGGMYAIYAKPMSRNRFVVSALMPALVISLVPLALGLTGISVPVFLQWASVANGLASGGDLLVVAQLLRHVDSDAIVLESQHVLYTQMPSRHRAT
jgi:hypothetical protein